MVYSSSHSVCRTAVSAHLRVLGRVDDLALSVHHPVHRDAGDHIGLDELKLVHKLSRGSRELRFLSGRVERLLAPSSLREPRPESPYSSHSQLHDAYDTIKTH